MVVKQNRPPNLLKWLQSQISKTSKWLLKVDLYSKWKVPLIPFLPFASNKFSKKFLFFLMHVPITKDKYPLHPQPTDTQTSQEDLELF